MLKQPTIAIQHGLRVSLLAAALLAALPAAAQTRLSLADLQVQITALQTLVTSQQTQIASLQSTLATTQTTLAAVQGNSVLKLNGVLSYDAARQTALFSGVDVQVTNGAGLNSINGRGNLIVGYNIARGGNIAICSDGEFDTQADCEANNQIWAVNHKNGSHNLIVGEGHAYSNRYGALFGYNNAANGWAAVVSGGSYNTAGGQTASVSGGEFNTATWPGTSVSGGRNRTAAHTDQWVAGGLSEPN